MSIRVKLRYALPAAQVLLAVGLYRGSDIFFRAMMLKARHEPIMGPSPAFTLLASLNAPLALLRLSYYRHLPEVWDRAVFILAIGLLWYWVALNFESWRRTRTIFTFSRASLRLSTDFLLAAAGVCCWFSSLGEWEYLGMPLSRSWWHWLSFLFCATWSLGLICFCGRDFILCVRKKPAQELVQAPD